MEWLINQFMRFSQVTNCPETGAATGGQPGCDTNLPEVAASPDAIATVLRIVFGVLGAVSVILIIYAGLLFITGQGDPQKIKDARNTIIWALIGLAIAIFAEAIVYLLLGRL